jgi:hypothetical protein
MKGKIAHLREGITEIASEEKNKKSNINIQKICILQLHINLDFEKMENFERSLSRVSKFENNYECKLYFRAKTFFLGVIKQKIKHLKYKYGIEVEKLVYYCNIDYPYEGNGHFGRVCEHN